MSDETPEVVDPNPDPDEVDDADVEQPGENPYLDESGMLPEEQDGEA